MDRYGFMASVTELVKGEQGEEKAEAVMAYAGPRCDALIAENASDSAALQVHSVDYIYPAIALYEGMRACGMGGEEAVDVIRRHLASTCREDNAAHRRWLKIPGLYHLVPRYFLRWSMKNYPEEAGYGYRVPEVIDPKAGRYDMVRCPYVDILTRYGCFEVCSAFCDSDDVEYADLHPRLRWCRTKSMGHGGDCCDFCIREAGPKERKKE